MKKNYAFENKEVFYKVFEVVSSHIRGDNSKYEDIRAMVEDTIKTPDPDGYIELYRSIFEKYSEVINGDTMEDTIKNAKMMLLHKHMRISFLELLIENMLKQETNND